MESPAVVPIEGKERPDPPCGQLANELARVNRALKTLSAGHRILLRATDEQELLRDMCRVIVDAERYRMAFVAYAESDEKKSIRWIAGEGMNIALLQACNFTWMDTESGRTVAGTAIRTGLPVVGRNMVPDPALAGTPYGNLMAQAVRHGYTSLSAFPLRLEGSVLGALVIGAGEEDAFDPDEVNLLCELADDLAYGIANLRLSAKHREARAIIERLAYYDSLTGLPNRAHLLETLEGAIEAARPQGHTLAVLHLEVGRFHEINKVLGYRAGDELLQELSRRLSAVVNPDQSLARVGEAEFALLLPHACSGYAIEVAQLLLKTLREPVKMAGIELDARVDIGIALFPGHATDADALIRRANAAMHQVKPTRGGYAVYMVGQEKEDTRRLALMGDLHRAIGQNELRLYCQPKVEIASRQICGAEALVRWQHPVHGMVPTNEFIQLAEDAGTITPLTNWMMEASFNQIYAWHEAGLERALAVNLSAHDLYDPGLVDRIRGMLTTWGISSSLIQFELTEGALMADPAVALETLTRLKKLDVKLFVDDYGTGYSSLRYLQELPIDTIKIDQSFVRRLVTSRDSAVIVSSTIDLGHKLGMDIVAEGVESQGIWDHLVALGCNVAQGYLISTPMPATNLPEWERHWS